MRVAGRGIAHLWLYIVDLVDVEMDHLEEDTGHDPREPGPAQGPCNYGIFPSHSTRHLSYPLDGEGKVHAVVLSTPHATGMIDDGQSMRGRYDRV